MDDCTQFCEARTAFQTTFQNGGGHMGVPGEGVPFREISDGPRIYGG